MNKLNIILKILLLLVFALFFSIIGLNKKTIDNFNDKTTLEENTDNLRGVIWANYTFMTISLAVGITIIVAKRYYYSYKQTVLFTIFFILLNTGLVVFEELSIKNNNTVGIEQLNNVYIISSVMNVVYFILFVRLIKITNDITPSIIEDEEILTNDPNLNRFRRIFGRIDRRINGTRNRMINRSPSTVTDDEPSYFEGYNPNNDEIIFDPERGITFRSRNEQSNLPIVLPRVHTMSY